MHLYAKCSRNVQRSSGNCLARHHDCCNSKEMGSTLASRTSHTRVVSRSVALYFNVGHVNIVLGKRISTTAIELDKNYQMTIDFLSA